MILPAIVSAMHGGQHPRKRGSTPKSLSPLDFRPATA
jgi:hypothetical protein